MADGKQVNGWRKISNSWQLTGELLENNYFQLGGSEPANNLKKKNCFKGLVVNCLLKGLIRAPIQIIFQVAR